MKYKEQTTGIYFPFSELINNDRFRLHRQHLTTWTKNNPGRARNLLIKTSKYTYVRSEDGVTADLRGQPTHRIWVEYVSLETYKKLKESRRTQGDGEIKT